MTYPEAKMQADPLERRYVVVEGPDQKKYYIDDYHSENIPVMLSIRNDRLEVGRIAYFDDKTGTISKKKHFNDEMKTIAYFVCQNLRYLVSQKEQVLDSSDAEKIHPLDYLLREIARND